MKQPIIIQGGMGVAISNWTLARAVSQLGQLGVVSGTGLTRVVTSRLTDGDLAGHVRRALASFSLPEPVQAVLDRYYMPGGKRPDQPYEAISMYQLASTTVSRSTHCHCQLCGSFSGARKPPRGGGH